jgi:tetratricopeptide (TPR) repeat protein
LCVRAAIGWEPAAGASKGADKLQSARDLALAAEASGQWKQAEARFREVLTAAPRDLAAHRHLARCLFWQLKVKDAYDVLKAAKRIDRESAAKPNETEQFLTPEAIMAQFYDQYEGDTKPQTGNAEMWFKAAVRNAPNDLATRQVVGNWALTKGKLPLAKEQADAALAIEESDSDRYKESTVSHMLRGRVALWEKDWPAAEKQFEKVLNTSAKDFSGRNNMALALVEQTDPAKKLRARELAEANYRDNTQRVDAVSTLAWVFLRRNEFDQASVVIEHALKMAGGNLKNYDTLSYIIAYMLHHRERDWQAKELLGTILKSDRPFAMRPEAEKLFEIVKDAKKPEAAPAATKP